MRSGRERGKHEKWKRKSNAIKITKYFPHINMTEYAGQAVDQTTIGIPSGKLKDLALDKCVLQEDLNK
ncbi:Hypothetical predicted protein [Octopus vulgaris]|uniref:Uncharacterized protein n=1 Tax=Octopus vulgaris TaxID=6645 RepID=A0AA36BD97_OCTVU|nr:Hypothetical predicted protein [Octopus vulgaris]